MSYKANGELIPEFGGDNIPLIRDTLTIGRRETCDICLRFPNVSGKHCELVFMDGFWVIRDLGSTNGIKVNGGKVPKKLLRPGDKISIAKKTFTIEYDVPASQRAMEEVLDGMDEEAIMAQSLLERAGLIRPRRGQKRPDGAPGAKPPQEIDLEQLDQIFGKDGKADE